MRTYTESLVPQFLSPSLKISFSCRFFDNKVGLWVKSGGQSNPVLSFPENLLEEEPVAMTMDEEEGAISDPCNEVMEETNEKMKVLHIASP